MKLIVRRLFSLLLQYSLLGIDCGGGLVLEESSTQLGHEQSAGTSSLESGALGLEVAAPTREVIISPQGMKDVFEYEYFLTTRL